MENHEEKLERFNINEKSATTTIMLCIMVDVLGYSMILPLLPHIINEVFLAPPLLTGLIIASNAGAAFFFAPLWGRLSDHYGRKPLLLISQFGTLASFLLLGLSNSIFMIFASRVLDGIFGGQIPIIRAYINDITEADNRSAKVGKFTGVMAFGTIFGPAIGGITGNYIWQIPPFIASILSITSIILVIKFLVESMPKERILELKERKKQLITLNGEKTRVLTGTVILRLLEIFSLLFIIQLFNTSFPYVLGERYGLPIFFIGLFAAISGVIMIIIGAGLIKPLTTKFGEKRLFIFAIVVGIFTTLLYPFMTEAWWLFIFIFPFVFSNVCSRTITQTALSKAVDEDKQGLVAGYATNVQSIGQIIAPIIAYSFLEVSTFAILGLTLDAYFFIGITCTLSMSALLIIALIDVKKHPNDFTKAKQITQNSRTPRELKAGAIVLINYNDKNWNGRDILKSEKILFAARNGIPLVYENEHDWDEFLLIKFNKSRYDDILERLENADLKEYKVFLVGLAPQIAFKILKLASKRMEKNSKIDISTLGKSDPPDSVDLERLQKIINFNKDNPIIVLNFLAYKEKAIYPEGHEGNDDELSGREAYMIYGKHSRKLLPVLGARIINAGRVKLSSNELEPEWEDFAFPMYPSFQTLMKMTSLKVFQDKDIHRRAGLSRTKLIVFSPYKEYL